MLFDFDIFKYSLKEGMHVETPARIAARWWWPRDFQAQLRCAVFQLSSVSSCWSGMCKVYCLHSTAFWLFLLIPIFSPHSFPCVAEF